MNPYRHVRAVDRSHVNRYLGDGDYAAFDGYDVWITAEDGERVRQAIRMSRGKRLLYSEPKKANAAYIDGHWWEKIIYKPGDPLP